MRSGQHALRYADIGSVDHNRELFLDAVIVDSTLLNSVLPSIKLAGIRGHRLFDVVFAIAAFFLRLNILFQLIVLVLKHWPVRLLMLRFANTEALVRHSEVLNFELLDSVTEGSIHLSQVYQLRVNTIHTYGLVRLLIVLCLLLVETSVLSIALTNLGPDS